MKKKVIGLIVLGLLLVFAFIVSANAVNVSSLIATGIKSPIANESIPSKERIKSTSADGDIFRIHEDYLKDHKSITRYYFTQDNASFAELILNEEYKIRLDSIEESKIENVTLSGDFEGKFLKVHDLRISTSSNSSKKTSPVSTTRKVKTAVVLVNFQNNSSTPFTPKQAKDVVFTMSNNTSPIVPSSSHVNQYYKEQTYNKVILTGHNNTTGDVYGWYTLPMPYLSSSTTCDIHGQFKNLADAAAAVDGFYENNYEQVIYFVPQANCNWSGVNGGKISVVIGMSPTTIAHELGHGIGGLWHSNFLACKDLSGNPVTYSTDCENEEYGDVFDVMGSAFRHMNIFQKESLGVVSPQDVIEVTQDGVYSIYAQETLSSPKVIKVGPYNLEYRKPFSLWDTFNPSDPVVNGLTLRIQLWLLDANPQTTSKFDSPIALGSTYTDTVNNISITVNSINQTTGLATATILTQNTTPVGCVHWPPSVFGDYILGNFAPLTSQMNVRMYNWDSQQCGPSDFVIGIGAGIVASPSTSFLQVLPVAGQLASNIVNFSPALNVPGVISNDMEATNVDDNLTYNLHKKINYYVEDPSCVHTPPVVSASPVHLAAGENIKVVTFSFTNTSTASCIHNSYSLTFADLAHIYLNSDHTITNPAQIISPSITENLGVVSPGATVQESFVIKRKNSSAFSGHIGYNLNFLDYEEIDDGDFPLTADPL